MGQGELLSAKVKWKEFKQDVPGDSLFIQKELASQETEMAVMIKISHLMHRFVSIEIDKSFEAMKTILCGEGTKHGAAKTNVGVYSTIFNQIKKDLLVRKMVLMPAMLILMFWEELS
jgi:hypothetical protein